MLGLFVSRGMGPDPGLRPPPSADQLPTSVHLSFAMSCIHYRIHVIQRGSEPREQLRPFWISRGGVGQAPGTSTKTRCYPVLCLCPPGSGLLWYSRISFNEWGRGAKPPKKTSGCCCTSSSSPATSISCRDSASLRSFFRCSLHTANSRVHRLLTFDTRGLFFDGMGIFAHGAMSMIRVHSRCRDKPSTCLLSTRPSSTR